MFSDAGIIKGVELSLNRLSLNYYLTGDFIKAGDKLKELLAGVQEDPRLFVNILGNLIFISAHIGRLEEADSYFNMAMDVLKKSEGQEDLHAWLYANYGFRFHASGDVMEAKRFGEKSNKISLRLKLDSLILFSYHLISIANYYLGNFETGFDSALKGLEVAKETGIKDASHAWLLIDAGFCASARGDTSTAQNYIHDALQICQELDSPWSEAWAYHVLQDAYLNEGNLFQAEKYAKLSLTSIEHITLPLDEGLMKGLLGSVLLEKRDLDNAVILIKDAEKIFYESKLNLCRVQLWYARYYWLKTEIASCLDKLRSALNLSQKNRYDAWVVYEKRWIIPLLVEIYPEEELRHYIDQIFIQIGYRAVDSLKQLEKSKDRKTKHSVSLILSELNKNLPSNLSIYCFGKFRLFRGNEEILLENWSSEKTKILFKYLIYKYAHGYIVKDKLLELLWPDEDPEITNNRFHVAMTTLRKALEPELPKGTPSTYILRDGESYRIEITEKGYMDIALFNSVLEAVKKETDTRIKLDHYLKAEALYTGDLFEEDQYEEWCIEAREDYKEKYQSILSYIINFYRQEKNHSKCIDYTKKYLAIDEYSEEMYQVLMKSYAEAGNKSMVIKTYEQCRYKIEDDLDCPLSDETKKLYKKLKA